MPTPLRLANTYSGQLEEFSATRPDSGEVTLYSCGPTVYSYAHIGNFRSFLFADLLRRTLERFGYRVRHVMNITDVGHMTEDHLADAEGEDKLAKAARELGWDPYQVARHYEAAFVADATALRLKNYQGADAESLDLHPRATEHVAEMLVMIQRLIERDIAYVDAAGQAYFDVSKFPEYGRLSGKRLEDLEAGARVEVREEKRSPFDFALWKVDAKHLMQWDPHSEAGWQPEQLERLRSALPQGVDPRLKKGFPGWHIECSAMAECALGPLIDIHTGGEDNIFPHHECEIAQSYCAARVPSDEKSFAKYWLHGRHLLVNGRKMSKRDGTFFTVRDLTSPIESGRPELADRLRELGFQSGKVESAVLRYALISTSYTQPLNFTFDLLVQSRQSLERLCSLYLRMNELAGPGKISKPIRKLVAQAEADFDASLGDNLSSARALAAVFTLVNQVNKETNLGPGDATAIRDFLEGINQVFDVIDTEWQVVQLTSQQLATLGADAGEFDVAGLEGSEAAFSEHEIELLLAVRHLAKQARDFATSDRVRETLLSRGIEVQDLAEGVRYRMKRANA